MEMIIHLDEDIFEIVKSGSKTIEARVNDEKRRKIKIGDKLIFLKRPLEIEKVEAEVVNLSYYNDFNELADANAIEKLYLNGYSKDDYVQLLKRFYNDDEIKKFGVVAITFKKL